MKSAHVTKLKNEMIKLRDNNTIDENINDQLEILEDKLDRALTHQMVSNFMSIETRDAIMEEVAW